MFLVLCAQRGRRKEKNLLMSGSNSGSETDLEVSPIMLFDDDASSFKGFDHLILLYACFWRLKNIEKMKTLRSQSVCVFATLVFQGGVINKASKLVGKY